MVIEAIPSHDCEKATGDASLMAASWIQALEQKGAYNDWIYALAPILISRAKDEAISL